MLKKIDISGVHMEIGDDLRKYVIKKLGRLEKYIPSHARKSARLEVKLKESKAKDKNERTCEALLTLPQENLTVAETTINIYAAVDIAEEKLKVQLRKYKDRHGTPKLRQRIIARLKRNPV